MDKLKSLDVQTYTEGLILAQDLLKNRLTPAGFAKKFSRLRKAELLENNTGLFTQAFFKAELDQETAEARRSGRPLTLIIFDLDKLKKINDTHGHLFGNKIILAVGKIIKSHIRQEDVPCRWGGDEFALILPDTNITGGVVLAARIQKAISQLDIRDDQAKIPVSLSIGISQFTQNDTPDSLFERTDQAAYQAKAEGRGLAEIA